MNEEAKPVTDTTLSLILFPIRSGVVGILFVCDGSNTTTIMCVSRRSTVRIVCKSELYLPPVFWGRLVNIIMKHTYIYIYHATIRCL